MLTLLIGLLLFFIFGFLSAIHFYWAFGGTWGSSAAVPTSPGNEKMMNPGMFDCLVVAFGLLAIGLFVLVKAEIFPFYLPGWLTKYGLWAISAIFILRAIGEFKYVGFFKKIKSTRFGRQDTKYYSPLCLVIAVLTILLVLSN